MGKLLSVLSVCLVATLFSLSLSSVAQEDESAKRKAIEQMRQIANALKECL
jgi:hypothetical protein